MPPSITPTPDIQAQLIAEIGDPNETLWAVVNVLWGIYTPKAALNPLLQVLYTKRGALDVRLAEEQGSTDYEIGKEIKEAASQLFTHLQQMRDTCHAEIVRIEAMLGASRAPAIGAITKTTPTSPPFVDSVDANDPRYRGSPYTPLPRW